VTDIDHNLLKNCRMIRYYQKIWGLHLCQF